MGADSSDDGGHDRLDEVILDGLFQVDDEVRERRRERRCTTPALDSLVELDLEAEPRDVLHERVVRLFQLRSSFPPCRLEDDQREGLAHHSATVTLVPDDGPVVRARCQNRVAVGVRQWYGATEQARSLEDAVDSTEDAAIKSSIREFVGWFAFVHGTAGGPLMASGIFAKIGDIKGESLDSKHKDEVEVLSWSWGVTHAAPIRAGSGGWSGKATFNDFNFTHHVDKESPVLLKACATGQHIKEATITVRKAGKGQQEFLIIKMSDVIITAVNPSGAADAAATAEHVALQFAKVDLEYKPQKADGSLDAGLHFKYDIKGNKEG